MKFNKAVSALLICSFFAFISGGCSVNDFSADNLLRPPKAMGDEAEIEQLIADNAKSGYTLKYPKNGNYRSAIIMVDLNGDENNEAIAFFRNSNDTALIHMLVMYSEKGEWKLSSDIITEATDIERVEFADIDSNNNLEILTGYTTYTTNINRLTCYSYSSGNTSEIDFTDNYSSFYCGDFDNDGNSEIITLLLYTTENEAAASLLDYNKKNNTVYKRAVAKMDSNVAKFKNVLVSDFDKNSKGLIIDGSYANDDITTQIIYFNHSLSQLRNPLFNEKEKTVTRRSCSVTCCDIDGDDITEIPVVTKLPANKNGSQETVADKIVWSSFKEQNETLTPKLTTIANYDYGYFFKYPEKWGIDSVTANTDKDNDATVFYSYNAGKSGDALFEIRVFKVDDWEYGKANDEYELISKDDKYAYTFKNINTELPVSLTDNEIKTGFINLNETTEQTETK